MSTAPISHLFRAAESQMLCSEETKRHYRDGATLSIAPTSTSHLFRWTH